MTDGLLMANQKQRTFCSPWNLTGVAKRVDVRAFSVHPGAIYTDLARHMTDEELKGRGFTRNDRHGSSPAGQSVEEGGEFKTLEQGAATSTWCGTSPQLAGVGGVYCEDVEIAQISESNIPLKPGLRPYAIDSKAAKGLWTLSEGLTGVKFHA